MRIEEFLVFSFRFPVEEKPAPKLIAMSPHSENSRTGVNEVIDPGTFPVNQKPETSPHYSWCESPMSKSLRSRPIDSCLEENGDRLDRSNPQAEMAQVAKRQRVGAIAYSCVRSLRNLLIGQTFWIAFSRTVNNAGRDRKTRIRRPHV